MKKYRTDDLRQMTPSEMRERLDEINQMIFKQRAIIKTNVVYAKGEPTINMLKKLRKQVLTVAREKGFKLDKVIVEKEE